MTSYRRRCRKRLRRKKRNRLEFEEEMLEILDRYKTEATQRNIDSILMYGYPSPNIEITLDSLYSFTIGKVRTVTGEWYILKEYEVAYLTKAGDVHLILGYIDGKDSTRISIDCEQSYSYDRRFWRRIGGTITEVGEWEKDEFYGLVVFPFNLPDNCYSDAGPSGGSLNFDLQHV